MSGGATFVARISNRSLSLGRGKLPAALSSCHPICASMSRARCESIYRSSSWEAARSSWSDHLATRHIAPPSMAFTHTAAFHPWCVYETNELGAFHSNENDALSPWSGELFPLTELVGKVETWIESCVLTSPRITPFKRSYSPTAVDSLRSDTLLPPQFELADDVATNPTVDTKPKSSPPPPNGSAHDDYKAAYRDNVRDRQRQYEKRYRENKKIKMQTMRAQCTRLHKLQRKLSKLKAELARLSELQQFSQNTAMPGKELHGFVAQKAAMLHERCKEVLYEAHNVSVAKGTRV